ncbi:hypothetical protein [Butyrivibrio fibrisolvens]|uniref:hypothetical protein n=1 Tax=Butyrivibrio fibrisolvens TaxID=831 RepID=UPI0003B7A175|nr:hypothetical protein [Butyrivibrio fibrisolvens]
MIKMLLDDLPRWPNDSRYAGKICWEKTIGCVVRFECAGEAGEFFIKSYDKVQRELLVVYKGRYFKIKARHFKDCHVSHIINNHASDFKIEIGTRFTDHNRDLIITDRKKHIRTDGGKRRIDKVYRYTCNKCGYDCGEAYKINEQIHISEYWTEESHLINGISGCACCSKPTHVVVPEINSIAKTNPEIVKFFENGVEEASQYTSHSMRKIIPKCPDCGRKKKTPMPVVTIVKNHSINCPCGKNIHYPERFMYCLLEQLNVDFIIHLSKTTFAWCGDYQYDFYFKLNDNEYIVETHGSQHFEESNRGRSLFEEKSNDLSKKNTAIANNIERKNYIEIDCRLSQGKYIKDSIENSMLSEVFDLSKIKWNQIYDEASSSFVKKACEIKRLNPHLLTGEIAKKMHLNRKTVRRYLKEGNEYGWCKYDPKDESQKGNKYSAELNRLKLSKRVEVLSRERKSLGVYNSARTIASMSEKIYGVVLNSANIQYACRKGKAYKGFYFRYLN